MHETPPVSPDSIRASIAAGLPCDEVRVRGDGHHFEALVVSAAFEGKSRVARHQMVYAALGDRMRQEIHALSMITMTPAEFAVARAQGQQ
jgi:acid stress-induced BolA-like protein IbaG/YrbA